MIGKLIETTTLLEILVAHPAGLRAARLLAALFLMVVAREERRVSPTVVRAVTRARLHK